MRRKLVISDLSSIEGRVLAWLAGEEWKIQRYRELDAGVHEFDMYELTYAETFHEEPTHSSYTRQLGKVIELFGGYQGGVGAFITFAANYAVDLNELSEKTYSKIPEWAIESAVRYWEKCDSGRKHGLSQKTFVACDAIKRVWRAQNPKTVEFWAKVGNAARAAIHDKGNCYDVDGMVSIDTKGSWLRIRLPSGRYLCYPAVRIDDNTIKFMGINQYSHKWCLLSTYEGRLVENIDQGISNDILNFGIGEAEKNGYPVVLHVHDEIVAEVPDDPQYNHETLSRLMSTVPPWAPGLPLNAKGFESYRYRKD